jgi:hypothetical protein
MALTVPDLVVIPATTPAIIVLQQLNLVLV